MNDVIEAGSEQQAKCMYRLLVSTVWVYSDGVYGSTLKSDIIMKKVVMKASLIRFTVHCSITNTHLLLFSDLVVLAYIYTF